MKTQLPIEHVFENMEKEGLEYPFFCEANPLLFVFLVDLYNCESTPSRTQFVLCVGIGKVELASAVASLTKYSWWYTKIGGQMQVAEVFKVFFFQTAGCRDLSLFTKISL